MRSRGVFDRACWFVYVYVYTCLSPSRPNLQSIFMCVYCITHREIKASCDKGNNIPYITNVIYRLTDISSPCHMTAKKADWKLVSLSLHPQNCMSATQFITGWDCGVSRTFKTIHIRVRLNIIHICCNKNNLPTLRGMIAARVRSCLVEGTKTYSPCTVVFCCRLIESYEEDGLTVVHSWWGCCN